MGGGRTRTSIIWDDSKVDVPESSVLCVGNFDGVHRGHEAVIREGKRLAVEFSRPLCVLSFIPHPRLIINPQNFFILLDFVRRVRIFSTMGVDHVVFVNFRKIRDMEHQRFCDFLEEIFRPCCVCVGFDFSFGRDARGKAHDVKDYFERLGRTVRIVEKVAFGEDQRKISSSILRKLVLSGDVFGYLKVVGRPYSVRGVVGRGSGRGKKLGVPTANVLTTYRLPSHGVYATFAKIEGCFGFIPSVSNVGYQPTFESWREVLETHLVGFSDDIYGRRIEVFFIEKIRDVMKFSSVEELKNQIIRDVERSLIILEDHKHLIGELYASRCR